MRCWRCRTSSASWNRSDSSTRIFPLLNFSINDALDFADTLDQALRDAQADPAGTLQVLEGKLKEAFGLPPSSTLLSLTLDESNGSVLNIGMQLDSAFDESVALAIPDIDIPVLGKVDLGGSADLGVNGTLGLNLDLGISLDNPTDVYLYNTTGIFGSLGASASDIDFRAALGGLGLFIKHGDASLSGTIAAGLDLNGDGDVDGGVGTPERVLLSTLLGDLDTYLAVDVDGDLSIDLPVYFPTENHPVSADPAKDSFGLNLTGADWTNLNGSTLTNALTLPDFSGVDLNLGLFDNILLMTDGFDLLLKGLENLLQGDIGGVKIPFIGDALSGGVGFVSDLRTDVVAPFRNLLETTKDFANDFQDPRFNVVSDLLFDLLGPGGADLLRPLDTAFTDPAFDIDPTAPDGVEDYIALDTDGENYIQWNYTLGGMYGVGTEVDFDFNIPGLGLETDGGIGLAFDWKLGLGMGLSRNEGFYIDVSDTNELVVDLQATLPDELIGRLGILQLKAEDSDVTGVDEDGDGPGDTRIGLAFAVDINNSSDSTDDRLGLAEFGRIGFDAGIAAEAVAELALTLGLNGDLFGLPANAAAGIPEIKAGFLFDWGIGSYDIISPEDSTFVDVRSIGDAIGDSLRTVEFTDVSLDVGSFLSDVLGPIVKEVKKITEPVQPLIDVLRTPVPVPVSTRSERCLARSRRTSDRRRSGHTIYSIADIISADEAAFPGPGSLVTRCCSTSATFALFKQQQHGVPVQPDQSDLDTGQSTAARSTGLLAPTVSQSRYSIISTMSSTAPATQRGRRYSSTH